MLNQTLILIALHIAMVAVVFVDLLQKPNMIFSKYGEYLDRQNAWWTYPIGYCAKCTAGHFSAWLFLTRVVLGYEPHSLAPWRAIAFVSLTILLTHITSNLLSRLNR